MARPTLWRVRVNRAIEVWVEVSAHSAAEAEVTAGVLPGVAMVFGKSAIPAGDDQGEPRRVSED